MPYLQRHAVKGLSSPEQKKSTIAVQTNGSAK